MPASTLQDACKRQAIRMISRQSARLKRTVSGLPLLEIDDFGTMPFRIVKPILVKVQNAEQLYRIEQCSPQFIGETRDIWLDLIKRDVPNWESKPHQPKNEASWYKVYRKLVREADKEVDEDALILQATLKNIEEERLKRTSKVVDSRTVPIPNARGSGARFPFKKIPQKTSDLRFTSGSRTKIVSGKDVIQRARREARERSNFIGGKSILARPTHKLNNNATTIVRAPASLVEHHRHPESSAANQSSRVKVFAPRKAVYDTPSSTSGHQIPHKMTPEEREARLRAIAAGNSVPSVTSNSGSGSASLKPRPTPAGSPPHSAPKTATSPLSRLAPPSPPRSSASSSFPLKRKREEGNDSIDDLFGRTPTPDVASQTSQTAVDGTTDRAKGTPEKEDQTSPNKKRKSNSPPAVTYAADGRQRARVQKAPVDIFMRRERRTR